jgi:hypothetical protein
MAGHLVLKVLRMWLLICIVQLLTVNTDSAFISSSEESVIVGWDQKTHRTLDWVESDPIR